ncbi:glycosyltransferase [Anaerorhabdus sp.]|uniref:glycosyltransferase n=1 Tax=Anaerorhabdus sp. TaxID=1872524 RepID=UPI002B1F35DF|nr:glycosyltransferase [Anaerorhabdus sp.]MEA4874880.1 glycosyltransferase [Anaerorhabdus sp.]
MPKLSVVMPIYNVEEYLPKCIESCLSQTYKDFELFLVNDGSKDNSLDICRTYEQKDTRIHVIDKLNGGLSDARNAGMRVATGEYIYFVDSDDFLERTCFEKCIAKLETTNTDMVIFDVYQYFMQTNTKEIIHNGLTENTTTSVKENPSILTKVLNAAWNKMYRKSLFVNNSIEYPVGYYYEDLGTTYKLMLMANKISFINEPLYDYLADRPGNITQQFNMKTYHIIDMINEIVTYYKEQKCFNLYYDECMYIAGINIMECLKKTRNIKDKEEVNKFIDTCFAYLKKEFPQFPKCKYKICRQKNDWIYANPRTLKFYLAIRKMWH